MKRMAAYVSALFELVAKSPAYRSVVIALLLACVFPLAAPVNTSSSLLSRENFSALLNMKDLTLKMVAGQDGQTMLVDSKALLREICLASNEMDYWNAVADYKENEAAWGESPGARLASMGQGALARAFADMDGAVLYETTGEMPGSYYLAYLLTSGLPYWAWAVVPVACAALTCWSTEKRRLLGCTPIGTGLSYVLACAASLMLATLLFLFALGISFAFACWQNGLGDFSYPVARAVGDAVEILGVGQLLAEVAVAMLLITATCTVVTVAFLRLLGRNAGLLASLVFIAIPLFTKGTNGATNQVLGMFPSAHFDFGSFTGRASYIVEAGQEALSGGVIETLASSTTLLTTLLLGAVARTFLDGLVDKKRRHTDNNSLNVEHISLAHRKTQLLRDISLRLEPGDICGLVAPNAMGKTTLLQAISGKTRALRSGNVTANEAPLGTARFFEHVLYTAEANDFLYSWMKPEWHLIVARKLWGCTQEHEACLAVFDGGKAPEASVGRLSSGTKQQVVIATALSTSCQYVLLDEPMNALDILAVERCGRVLSEFAAEGRAFVVASHILENLDRIATRVLFIRDFALEEMGPRPFEETCRERYHRLYIARDPHVNHFGSKGDPDRR